MKRIVVGLLAVAMAGSSFASVPALIPMPREMKLTKRALDVKEFLSPDHAKGFMLFVR